MKKAVFLLTLFLTISIASSCVASSSTPDPILDTYDVTCSLWDIPWYCSPEEFLSSVKDKQGLTFIPTDDPACYALSAPADFCFFGEPVNKCMAYFNIFWYGFNGEHISVYAEPSDLRWRGTVFDFFSLANKTVAKDGVTAFARLYDKLFAQYGPPLDAFMWIAPHPNSEVYSFSLPIANHSVDQSTLIHPFSQPHSFIRLVARFDSLILALIGEPATAPDSFLLRLVVHDSASVTTRQYAPYTVDVEFE